MFEADRSDREFLDDLLGRARAYGRRRRRHQLVKRAGTVAVLLFAFAHRR